jgi:predicted nucleic acid-binding protein
MKYLLDTGILLRLVHPSDARHQEIVDALASLKSQGHSFYTAMQNIAEFWNVSTRPATARGGFGLTPDEAERRLGIIERAVEVVIESSASYIEWKRLVKAHGVCGVEVHDARLVALMTVQSIDRLLTLNADDFKRFSGLAVMTPLNVIEQQPKGQDG